MTEASDFSKPLVITRLHSVTSRERCYHCENLNLKINIINYSYWLILCSLYSILFYCNYTLILYFLRFTSYFTGFVSTRMLTCFLLSNFSFILSQQTQVNLLTISKIVMLLCLVSCCKASSLSTCQHVYSRSPSFLYDLSLQLSPIMSLELHT